MSIKKVFPIIIISSLLGLVAVMAWDRYSPYIIQEDICFARNGVAVGEIKACREASASVAIMAQVMELGLTARTPWGKAELYREVVERCRRSCLNDQSCSFYLLATGPDGARRAVGGTPPFGGARQISGGCFTFK